jgi:dihydroxyacetone kinase-like protein
MQGKCLQLTHNFVQAEGIKVKQVITNDDVVVKDSLYTVGRRGVQKNINIV